MAERLQRHLGPVHSLLPRQFTVETLSGRPAICCPKCGAISDLPITHRDIGGGVIAPIWSCPIGPCSYQEFIVLEDIGEEVIT